MMRESHIGSEEGAVFIHVALALVVLLAFSAFVVDYGFLWVSRSQAQNSADAGALAGAISLAFDGADDKAQAARDAATEASEQNRVYGEAPGVQAQTPYPTSCPGDGTGVTCIRVDTYRDGTNQSNLMPTWFAQLLGINTQGVRAMAVAQAAIADSTNCLKPWAVMDKWDEHWFDGAPREGSWEDDSIFEKYQQTGADKGAPDPAITAPDAYRAPTTGDPGSGFHPFNSDGSFSEDYGRRLVLKQGNNNDFQFGGGWFRALRLEDSNGGNDYRNNIKSCVGTTYKIGDEIETENGMMVGPTNQGVEQDVDSLYEQDPGAYWDPTMNHGRGGVAGSAFAISPRIVAIPLVNPDVMAQRHRNEQNTVPISNIMGFFVEPMDGNFVVGRLVTVPGFSSTETPSIGGEAAFLWQIRLVR